VITGVITVTGAICVGELAAMMPHVGGTYVFFRKAYSPAVGFVFGWAMLLVIQTGTIAAVGIAFAKFLGVLLPELVRDDRYLIPPLHLGSYYALSLNTQQLVAVAIILLLTVVNMRGLGTGKVIQNIFTVSKTVTLAGLIVVGLVLGWHSSSAAAFTTSWWDPAANPGWPTSEAKTLLGWGGSLAMVLLLSKAMIGPLFSQTAWNNVTFTGSEVVDPERTLPRSLVFGTGLVVLLYLLANVAYVVTLPLPDIQHASNDRVATRTLEVILGRWGADAAAWGAGVMAVLIMISTFGCDNGLILAGARIYYAMAHDGLFFRAVGRLNARHAPALALLVQGVWAALLTLPRTVTPNAETGEPVYGNVYSQLLEFLMPMDLMFYGLMVAAVIVLRYRDPDAYRPYRTWGYPVVPIVFLILAGFVVVTLVCLGLKTSGIGFLIVCSGVPVYFLWSWLRPRSADDYGGS
jgi:APA family basic amino acid/polyamine antiporter